MNNPSASILKTKSHFEVLDGLRGIAAVAIVIFHFMEWAYSDFSKNFIGHGFLAVDFFFCLSGFVIGYAYDDRIEKMGVLEFFKSRLIRLHPMIILGSILGLAAFLFDPFGGPTEAYNTGRIFLIFLSSIFLIPFPTMEERAFNLFGFNAPAWSLFWEYAANLVYAFVLYRIARRYLIPLAVLAAAALCMVSYDAGNLLGGWNGETFWHGGARISYSFLAGLLIYRYNWIIKNRIGFIGLAILLTLAFIMPWTDWNWVTEPLVVLFYFPLIVSLGAGTALAPGLKRLCVFSGNISYPLYMTHYAAIWIFGAYYTKFKPATLELTLIIITGTILLIGIAWLAMALYDIPVRRYLTNWRKQQ
ncbi:acyltransferase [Flavihumibacter sp. R14]|nr:acyltransferase [Flavihumibacter soli]